MEWLSRYFWHLIPITLAVFLYRNAGTEIRHLWYMTSSSEYRSTYTDLQGVAGHTAINFKLTQKLPSNFEDFLMTTRLRLPGRDRDTWLDAWGTTYQLVDHGEKFDVMSCGADRDCTTSEDNLVESAIKVRGKAMSLPAIPGAPVGMEKLDMKNLDADKINAETEKRMNEIDNLGK